MPEDTASDLLHTNQEYEKLKTKHGDTDYTPRETPGQQGPGGRGYDKAMYANWTREELMGHLRTLEVDFDEGASHESLVELLGSRDATAARAGD